MAEFILNGETHQARKLPAMDQFHISRKLSYILAFLAKQPDKAALAEGFPRAFASVSGDISDKDMEAVVKTCLSAVSRKQATGWAPVAPGGTLMFSDLDDLRSTLVIIWNVLQANGLIDFFVEPPSASGMGTTETAG